VAHPRPALLRIADVTTTLTTTAVSEASRRLTPLTPALYPTRVSHLHRSPVRHYGEHRSYSWLVDVDDLPAVSRWLRPFARFEAKDHLHGRPGDSLRQRVDAVLAEHCTDLPGGKVIALLMPRVLGRSFNPLSLFWCHDRAGALRAVIAEVQTVRGERHAYVLPPSGQSPAAVAPARSQRADNTPFAADKGYFLVNAPLPGEQLDLTVALHDGDRAVMVANWRGRRRRASAGRIMLTQLTTPLAPQAAELAMRLQAVMLRLRGVPQTPTPASGQAARSPLPAGWAAGRSLAAS